MQFRHPHPWDPNYALPDNVLAEPGLRGTMTTKYMPRRTIDAPALAQPWKTGYAYPDYVNEEPIGAGVFRTKYMPRRTVDALVPEYLSGDDLQSTPEMNVRGGDDWLQAAEHRYGISLGGYTTPINAEAGANWIAAAERRYGTALGDEAHAADAIGQFGLDVADYVLGSVRRLPVSERMAALRNLFDHVEPGLWPRITRKVTELREAKVAPPEALRRAIASQTSYGLLTEILRTAKTGAVRRKTLLGLGCCGLADDETVVARRGKPVAPADAARFGSGTKDDPWKFSAAALSGRVRDHRIMALPPFQDAWQAGLAKVASFPEWVGLEALMREGKIPFSKFKNLQDGGKTWGLYFTEATRTLAIKRVPPPKKGRLDRLVGAIEDLGSGVMDAVRWAAEKGLSAAKAGAEFAKDAAGAIAGLACKVIGSEVGQLAAGAGAAAVGEPPQLGVAGAQIAAGICAEGTGVPLPPPAAPAKFPLMPVVLIGGGLLAAALFFGRRKKGT